jgi:hypothetical protein
MDKILLEADNPVENLLFPSVAVPSSTTSGEIAQLRTGTGQKCIYDWASIRCSNGQGFTTTNLLLDRKYCGGKSLSWWTLLNCGVDNPRATCNIKVSYECGCKRAAATDPRDDGMPLNGSIRKISL